jgi:hypothetical protein
MTVHQNRLKVINFTIGATAYDCQIQSWNVDPGVQDGDRQYTYCSSGVNSFIEETDSEPTLQLKFYSDWRSPTGLSSFLWQNPNVVATFQLDHHPDIASEHVVWSGSVLLQPPPAGGDARDTEISEITLMVIGGLGTPGGLVFTPAP